MKKGKKPKSDRTLRESRKTKTKSNKKIIYASLIIFLVAFLSLIYLFKYSDTVVGEAIKGKFLSPAQRAKIPAAEIMKGKSWTDPAQYKTNSNTWTEAIQKALGNSKNVRLAKNQIYEVVKSGQKNLEGVLYDYSLSIPSGVALDLNGATIKLADGQNAIVLINENPSKKNAKDSSIIVDSGIKIFGGTFDGNEQGQTINNIIDWQGDVSVIEMIGVNNLEIDLLPSPKGRGFPRR